MSLGGTKVDAIDVGAILAGVDDRLVVLPDFQRKFEWSEADTIAVLATILTKWPIGSLLLLEGAPAYLRTRPFNGVTETSVDPPEAEYVVLDGQQRITSLFHALWNRGKRVFAINLLSLEEDPSPENLEEAIETIDRKRWTMRYSTPQAQLASNFVPIHALRSPSDFFSWRDRALEAFQDPERSKQYDRISGLYKELFSGLDRYRVPAIIIPKDTPPGAIARIFERVNKTGMKLSTFDLMVAIAYDGTFNLRDEWDRARLVTAPLVGDFFGDDGMPALHVMSLRHAQSLRDSAVVQMSGEKVRSNWLASIEGLERAASFARRYLGVNTISESPHLNSILVLAALSRGDLLEDRREEILKWFWTTSFGGRYDIASNTRAVSDFREFREGAFRSRSFGLVHDDLIRATRRQRSSFHRAFAAYTASRIDTDRLSSLSGLVFETVVPLSATVSGVVTAESTLTFAWKLQTMASDEANLVEVVNPGRQLLPLATNWADQTTLAELRLVALADSLKRDGLSAVIVRTEEEAEVT